LILKTGENVLDVHVDSTVHARELEKKKFRTFGHGFNPVLATI
jgi:hypothetical protein